jgi:hypothetical protein
MKKQLNTYCEEHWWIMGSKTLSFKGKLKDLLKSHNISFRKVKTEHDGLYYFYFKSPYGISWKASGLIEDFPSLAKRFIQMELVRIGDKSTLYVKELWRPKVTVNH